MRLVPTDMAHGGSAVARVDGKAYFVDGALPGEVLTGKVTQDRGSWGRVELTGIIEASPDRVDPPCPYFSRCGGCQWQFADYRAQLRWKESIVRGQLEHLGGLSPAPVRATVAAGPEYSYRNRMDFRVANGRPALFERRSRNLVELSGCLLLHPNLAAVFERLEDLHGMETVTLRTSEATGAVLAVISGRAPSDTAAWGCAVAVEGRGGLRAIHGEPTIVEDVAGVSFRITGRTFFQNNTAGALALTELVRAAADIDESDTLLDAYAGGGLFAATVGRKAGRVIAIERDRTAAADLQANLASAGITESRVISAPTKDAIERIDEYWDVAIADPPRTGLGLDGVAAVTAASPRTVVYVSCDPASLARDTRILGDAGWNLDWATPVDIFPQTFHIETVARYIRAG